MDEADLLRRLGPGTLDDARALPRPMVFTNGVFDLLHRGHVGCLMRARALGASLVVGLNGDASARRLGKGPGRPLNDAGDRCAVLRALACVDAVLLFDEDKPLALIRALRPEVYVKGGDYDIEALDETALVRSWGGRALALPLLAGRSTTRLVECMRGAPASAPHCHGA
jgi:D-glycero-beta-D-manno-heptose 1-phosphate adenylyltransferase